MVRLKRSIIPQLQRYLQKLALIEALEVAHVTSEVVFEPKKYHFMCVLPRGSQIVLISEAGSLLAMVLRIKVH